VKVTTDFSKPPVVVKPKTDKTKTDNTKPTAEVILPYLYADLKDTESTQGWCCEKAGGLELLCGEKTIGGKKTTLVPDNYTPKSTDFASDDLAVAACW